MTFAEAAATQPLYLQIWFAWLVGVMFLAPLVLLAFAQSRRIGLVCLIAALLTAAAMPWLYAQVGYVRLLGLGHVVIWTPLLVYLWPRLRSGGLTGLPLIVAWVFFATLAASLVIDYVDVIRWLLGDRASLIRDLS